MPTGYTRILSACASIHYVQSKQITEAETSFVGVWPELPPYHQLNKLILQSWHVYL